MKKGIALVVLVAVLPLACGSIFHGTKEEVAIRSEPACSVKVDGADYQTPCVLKLKRGKEHTITFEKEGYTPKTVILSNHVAVGSLIANILLTGLIGIVVDFADGAAYGFDAKEVNVALEEKGMSLNLRPEDGEVCVVLAERGEVGELPTENHLIQ